MSFTQNWFFLLFVLRTSVPTLFEQVAEFGDMSSETSFGYTGAIAANNNKLARELWYCSKNSHQ